MRDLAVAVKAHDGDDDVVGISYRIELAQRDVLQSKTGHHVVIVDRTPIRTVPVSQFFDCH